MSPQALPLAPRPRYSSWLDLFKALHDAEERDAPFLRLEMVFSSLADRKSQGGCTVWLQGRARNHDRCAASAALTENLVRIGCILWSQSRMQNHYRYKITAGLSDKRLAGLLIYIRMS